MSFQNKVFLGLGVYAIWVALWLLLTMYVTGGDPHTWGRVVFAFFGPVCGIVVAFGAVAITDEELAKERKASGK